MNPNAPISPDAALQSEPQVRSSAGLAAHDEDDDFDGEPAWKCERCHDRGWIPAMNGEDEYLGDGEIRCPSCMKGLCG